MGRGHEQIKLKGDATGRLMRFDPRTRRVTVLRSGLPFPNGVAVSRDRTHLFVSHTSARQLFRHWLGGPRATGGESASTSSLPTCRRATRTT
ncbi:hypothetical protein ABZP36_015426 [Zizania latifolia]